jgi:inorganic pyrophosphatase
MSRVPHLDWRPHPWHGLEVGDDPPRVVTADIELTPFDLIKYEVDKRTGYLRVDRPQRTSASPPTLYGFIPRTYCASRVAALSPTSKRGDGDPLDVCVVSERPIARSEVILSVRVVGGFQMVDAGDADDKIIAVLVSDAIWGEATRIADLPAPLIERLRHYFLTYKLVPGKPPQVSIEQLYDAAHAQRVIEAAMADYFAEYSGEAVSESRKV